MAQLKESKILVTGGAGFIGYHLCKKLTSLTPYVTIYDNLSSGKLENVKDVPKAKFVKGDILNLKQLCNQEKADLIFHLAAQVVVPYSMENPTEDFETAQRYNREERKQVPKSFYSIHLRHIPYSLPQIRI